MLLFERYARKLKCCILMIIMCNSIVIFDLKKIKEYHLSSEQVDFGFKHCGTWRQHECIVVDCLGNIGMYMGKILQDVVDVRPCHGIHWHTIVLGCINNGGRLNSRACSTWRSVIPRVSRFPGSEAAFGIRTRRRPTGPDSETFF